MQIWVDADACPLVIKEILYRAAERTQISTTLVANQFLRIPASAYINCIEVPTGFDAADNKIVLELAAGDLVITADIPLAAQVVAKGAHALNPRGEMYTPANMHEHLTMRNMMAELHASGIAVNGPAAFSHNDRQAFAAALDQFLAKIPQRE